MKIASALILVLALAAPVWAKAPSFQELEESLTCQCGCGLTVHSCNHLQCPSAIPLRQEIREQMDLGKDKGAILAHFAGKYGEKILSSPTASGFNLAAWVTPFVVIGLGGVFVLLTVRRWARRTRTDAGAHAVSAPPSAAATAHEKILQRELDKFDD